MVDVSASITINRPVEDVFAYVTDVTNDPAWHTAEEHDRLGHPCLP